MVMGLLDGNMDYRVPSDVDENKIEKIRGCWLRLLWKTICIKAKSNMNYFCQSGDTINFIALFLVLFVLDKNDDCIR